MFHPLSQKGTFRHRRHFLRMSSALAMGTICAPILQARARAIDSRVGGSAPKPGSIMQIGILLGTFPESTYEAKLDAVKSCGLACIQLSLDCAGVEAMPDQISGELAERIRREAAARKIAIASVQGTFNMSHPDSQHRQKGLRRLRVLAESCSQMGTSRVHLCTGTRDPENMWRRHPGNDSPEAWADMTACVRAAADIAKQTGVVLGFEPEVNNVVDSAQKARRLLDEIGSPNLKVTMDAANLFHAGELPRMKEILDEAFALVGKDIVMAHAKDLDHDGDAGHKAAGQGKLDYSRYLSLLHTYGFEGPLLLHGLSEAQVPGCIAFLREKMPS
jgi:sugar phosphate isomerase/epimerase